MNSQNKISLILLGFMFGLFIILTANILFNFRDYGLKSIEQKAETVAATVKHSLTSHMMNGVIDNRGLFLDQIKELENIDKLWIVRGESVFKQYGKGHTDESPRDQIDKDVLAQGVSIKEIKEDLFGESSFRITIPYTATTVGSIDCISCHDAKEGDTLGAITMVMNMNDLKSVGSSTIINTLIIAFVLITFILLFVNRLIGPYIRVFDSIKYVMSKAKEGDYSKRVDEKGMNPQSKDVAKSINGFLTKLQTTVGNIEDKIEEFLTVAKKEKAQDPLIDVENTVTRLADIYRFRKTIEHDESLDDVYGRISDVLKNKFGLNDFNFIEADTTKKLVKVAYIEKQLHCEAEKGCRADRTNTVVDSCQFKELCDKVTDEEHEYLCIPYSISNDLDFILNINVADKERCENTRDLLPHIQDYIDAAKPEIVSKKLMEILERSARTDGLTGLYNRKFLEESVEKIVNQAKRANISYGVLMADIDYFKMINDTYGHDVGDEAIKVVASTLSENVRNSDFVIRYGGEEFIVLLYNCDADYIVEVAEKIRVAFAARKISAGTTHFSKTISIGAAIFPDTADSFWKCIKFADMALYHAKENGRNQVKLFDESLLGDDQEEGAPY